MKTTARKPAAKKASVPRAVSPPAPAKQPVRHDAPASPLPAKAATAVPVAPSASPRKAAPVIPSILLEGDEPSLPRPSGPGERFALGLTPAPAGGAPSEPAELPESYGTQKLFLTARDPQWLFAHWDFSHEQLRRYNARSADRHMVLRVYKNAVEGEPHREIHVHPESRNWFANVDEDSTRYVAELGYYMAGGDWVSLAVSGSTLTPAATMSEDLTTWFETLPVDVQFESLLRLVKHAVRGSVPLMEALQQLRATEAPSLPDFRAATSGRWTPEQEKALAAVVTMDSVRRVWMGSLEITELIRRQFLQELSSQAAAQRGEISSLVGAAAGAAGVSSVSSPFGGMAARGKGFWFNVNAELILYGATEPDATVTIGGRTIRLRPDGTFSYRFVLPDGRFELPAIATSADGTDSRTAALEFSRTTQYRGEVHAHPQDPALKPPLVQHVS